MTGAPLLELRDVRIDSSFRPLIESVSFSSSGDRLGLTGRGRAIFDAFCGTATMVSGSIQIQGVSLEEARRSGRFAVATAWPAPGVKRSGLSIVKGLCASALLAGASHTEAKRRAHGALEKLGLTYLAEQRLTAPSGLLHHLAGLAEAALFEPEVFVVDWPIAQLGAEAWARYGTALSKLLERRPFIAWVSGAPQLPVERSWLLALDELVLLDSEWATLVPTGASSQVRTRLIVAGTHSSIEPKLAYLDLAVTQLGERTSNGSVASAYLVDLPRDASGLPRTESILAWSAEHQLPIVQLEPITWVC